MSGGVQEPNEMTKILRSEPMCFMEGLRHNTTLERLSLTFTKLTVNTKKLEIPLAPMSNNTLRSLTLRFPSIGKKVNGINTQPIWRQLFLMFSKLS
jgi:hypothetical protein